MDPPSLEMHLSQIQTLWTLVRQAHADAAEKDAAQRQLLERYGGAVHRYLRGALRDPEAAEEAFQDFAYRLLHGDLAGADPQRGRFRYFVKGVLFHMVADHHRRQQRQPRQMHPDMPEPAAAVPPEEEDRAFLTSWRDEMLARAWQALQECEQRGGQPFFTVLRFKVDHAAMTSARLAEALSGQLGKRMTAAGVRQCLHRARDQFADRLLDEVVNSLDRPTVDQLHEELIDLELLEYCRPALERRGQSSMGVLCRQRNLMGACSLSPVLGGEGWGEGDFAFASVAPSPPSPLPRVQGRGGPDGYFGCAVLNWLTERAV